MNIKENIQSSLANIRSHKLRSFLTMLGMIIGISAVITILAIGQSAQGLIVNQITGAGTNLIGVLPGKSDENGPPASVLGITVTTLTYQDAQAIAQADSIAHISAVAAYVRGVASAVWRNRDVQANFTGTTVTFPEVEDMAVASGRFFNESEERTVSRVAVLGSQVAEDLFDGADPIGQDIKIKREIFKVIGVMESRGASFFVNQDDQIFVPIRSAQKLLLGVNHVNFIRAKVDQAQYIDQATEDIKVLLRERHDITNTAEDDFSVRNIQAALDVVRDVTNALNFFLVAIASIALFVGGIGIMNIMLVAVNERIREIGLRKAVGATRGNILSQFLVETIVISLFGGILGIAVGAFVAGVVAIGARYLGYDWNFIVSLNSIVLACSFSVAVGVIFGTYPAWKAARLDPITALRYE